MRGPYDTLSGWPIGSTEDMAFHRSTGEQISKAKAEGIVVKGPPVDYYGGRTTIYVGDDADFDKIAERDLPEGVQVVVTNAQLMPDGWDGVVIDYSPKLDPDEFGKLAADMQEAFAKVDYSGMAKMAEGLATAVSSFGEVAGEAYADLETRTSNYFDSIPRFEDTDWYQTGRIHDSRYYSRLSAVTDKNAKRVAKDRARNKAARKQRQQRRK